jgi:hypothetical protein
LQDNHSKNIGAINKMQNDQNYIYTPSTTDITIRWRKLYNYIPASEQLFYQNKWKEFRDLVSRTLNDVNPEKPKMEVYPFTWKKTK